MFIEPSNVLSILEHYKYWIIFPVAIVEGPIIIIISGFLAYLGILNAFVVYIVLVIADTIGDSLYYLIGRYWRSSAKVKKVATYLGYNEKSEEFLEGHFKKHKIKTFLLAKISHGIGGSVQVAAGIAKVNFLEFLLVNIITTIPKTLILFMIGFYVGGSYLKIDGYLDRIALITISIFVFIVLYFLLRKPVKDFFSK